MKKVLSFFVGAMLVAAVACNDTSKADAGKADSAKAKAKADSIAAAMKDQHMKDSMAAAAADTTNKMKGDDKMKGGDKMKGDDKMKGADKMKGGDKMDAKKK